MELLAKFTGVEYRLLALISILLALFLLLAVFLRHQDKAQRADNQEGTSGADDEVKK